MQANETKPKGWVLSQRVKSTNVIQSKTPAKARRTEAQLYENGYTYNEPGFTYDQAGVAYGGVYGSQDVRPLVSLAQGVHPTIMRSYDNVGTATPVGGSSGMLIGMLGLTYP